MADDMGYSDPDFNGKGKIKTPHIQRLAGEGLRFTDAHSSSAVCSPSRYSLLTGRYAWRTRLKQGVLGGFSQPLIEPTHPTLASFLKDQGYRTAAVGKWHLGMDWALQRRSGPDIEGWDAPGFIDYTRPIRGGPVDVGFDSFYGIAGSLNMPPFCFIEDDHVVSPPTLPAAHPDTYWEGKPEGLMSEDWDFAQVDVIHTRKAVDFIESAGSSDKPFFLYMAVSAPHSPWVPPPFIEGKSGINKRADLICLIDWMVGEIDKALEANGKKENTLFIISSDNGAITFDYEREVYGHSANGSLRGGKGAIFEGGHRIPLVMRWPEKIPAGTQSDALVSHLDFFATFAEILGTPTPTKGAEDSISFWPVLTNPDTAVAARNTLVCHSTRGRFALRDGPWKLIDAADAGTGSKQWRQPIEGEPYGRLFNLDEDTSELHNLWLDHPDRIEGMLRTLAEIQDARP